MPAVSSMWTGASRQPVHRQRQALVLVLAQVSGAQPVRVDLRLRREHAQVQLLLGHLQTEEADRLVRLVPTCWATLRTKAVFPIDGRAATMIRSAGCSPAVRLSMSSNPVGTPVTRPLCAWSCSIAATAVVDEGAQRDEAVVDAVLGDREDLALRLVEHGVGILLRPIGRRDDAVRGVDQAAKGRVLLDDARVVVDVRRPRDPVGEGRDVGGPRRRLRGRRPGRDRP